MSRAETWVMPTAAVPAGQCCRPSTPASWAVETRRHWYCCHSRCAGPGPPHRGPRHSPATQALTMTATMEREWTTWTHSDGAVRHPPALHLAAGHCHCHAAGLLGQSSCSAAACCFCAAGSSDSLASSDEGWWCRRRRRREFGVGDDVLLAEGAAAHGAGHGLLEQPARALVAEGMSAAADRSCLTDRLHLEADAALKGACPGIALV
mmetsp:Transcript_27494/g.80238  ORF Transcript_27494/g.80238 Transcript_27494/m.80238 type:complete len:207 (-) Transcript_27494:2796-3416(-)